ncbi:MAG: hypothetical protein JJ979_03290 [Roseibium sp.]|nr:hypothetical protein [Roseibium sp.]
MKRYPVGAKVPVEIPFVDLNGDTLEPTGVFARVIDAEGTEVLAEQSLPLSPGDTYTEWEVPAAANALAADQFEDLRSVEVRVVTDMGTFRTAHSYLLLQSVQLSMPTNSFQTYESALLEAERTLDLDAFKGAEQQYQVFALRRAYESLTRLRLKAYSDTRNNADNYEEQEILPAQWQDMTADEWTALPSLFKSALKRAQVIEANHLLTHDPVADRHEKGLLSESIGESSMMFRSTRPIDLGISSKSLQILARYIVLTARTARA